MIDGVRRDLAVEPSSGSPPRETLQAQILARLEEEFLTGVMLPGRKLTLRTLASSMGTSLMPVRDALQHLQSIGALEAQPNRTLVVPVYTPSELRDIVEIRFRMESFAVERLALTARRNDLRCLRENLEVLESARQKSGDAGYRRAHWRFHLAIVEASGIDTLVNLVRALWLQIGPNVKLGAGDPASIEAANEYHRAIFDAIAAGHPNEACKALESDIFYGIDRQQGEQQRARTPACPGMPDLFATAASI